MPEVVFLYRNHEFPKFKRSDIIYNCLILYINFHMKACYTMFIYNASNNYMVLLV